VLTSALAEVPTIPVFGLEEVAIRRGGNVVEDLLQSNTYANVELGMKRSERPERCNEGISRVAH